jgi:hypothetical protein
MVGAVGAGGIGTKFAVTATGLSGIVNVVTALLALTKATPPLVTVQLANCCPVGAVPAVIVTVVPCGAAAGLAVPFVTVIAWGVSVAATNTATSREVGVIAYPLGFAIATVTSAPFATVIFDMPRVKVVAFTLVSVPLVAPVTVISVAASVVGLALKVRVSWVVVVVALPLAVRVEKVMLVGAMLAVVMPKLAVGTPA